MNIICLIGNIIKLSNKMGMLRLSRLIGCIENKLQLNLNNRMFDAIMEGDLANIRSSINRGANVNAYTDRSSNYVFYSLLKSLSPLLYALVNARNFNVEVFKLLIELGADVNSVNVFNYLANLAFYDHRLISPLFRAVQINNIAAVEILINAGAKLDYVNYSINKIDFIQGVTALSFAIYNDPEKSGNYNNVKSSWEAIKLLIDRGANVNFGSDFGDNAIKMSEISNRPDVLAYIENKLLTDILTNLPEIKVDQLIEKKLRMRL